MADPHSTATTTVSPLLAASPRHSQPSREPSDSSHHSSLSSLGSSSSPRPSCAAFPPNTPLSDSPNPHHQSSNTQDEHSPTSREATRGRQWLYTATTDSKTDFATAQGLQDMPSDLRPSIDDDPPPYFSQPLLSGDESRQSYDTPNGGLLSLHNSACFDRDAVELETAKATRKRYTYAAGFLLVSLFSFAVQTETAVYIQHNLKWSKAYCMLYFTHGSWTLLYPFLLLVLRIRKWQQPWPVFWRRHWALLRHTGQMVEHRTLQVPTYLQKKSPIPYFLRTTAFVTTSLTVAGGSWYVAVNLTTPSDLTAIYNCSAFFAYAFAVPMLNEKLRWNKAIAVGIAIVGVLVVAYGDQGTAKHGSKSGGGSGGAHAPSDDEASNRALGNLIIGGGSILYGFYEVLYKRVACPPDGCSPDRVMILANTFGSLIGSFTLLVLWIPLPILHYLGWETFELPRGEAAWMLAISVLANATFSGCFLVLISLTSPVLSSVAALLTIFLVALCDEMLPPPLYSPLTFAAIMGGLLIIFAFLLLSWATYVEINEEAAKYSEEIVHEDDFASE